MDMPYDYEARGCGRCELGSASGVAHASTSNWMTSIVLPDKSVLETPCTEIQSRFEDSSCQDVSTCVETQKSLKMKENSH